MSEPHLCPPCRLSVRRDRRFSASPKLTQLADVEPNTAIGYMKELITKYKPGKRIKDGPYARINYPDLIGEELKGKWVLEVPVQRREIPSKVLVFARQHRITINQVHSE